MTDQVTESVVADTEEKTKFNPLIHKMHKTNLMPGVTFRLPSRGLSYTNGELSDEVVDGEIIVHPMSTLDEIYLKSTDMLFQGTAVQKTVARCCPQILKPLELLSKDVDYILTCMRQVSYGNILSVPFTCNCANAKDTELSVPISDFLTNTKTITDESMKLLSFELDGFQIKSKYVTFGQMVKINQDTMTESSVLDEPEEIFSIFIKNISANINNIDGVVDQELIIEFLKAQNRQFQMAVLKHIQDVNDWGVNFEYKFVCKYCKNNQKISIALNPVSFFTEPSSQAALINADK
jgi:hypothetical protein